MEITNPVKRAKLSPKVSYSGFRQAFDNLPYCHRLTVRREFQKRLKWSPSSFYYKRNGETPLRESEVPIIKEIFERFGINPWTGDKN